MSVLFSLSIKLLSISAAAAKKANAAKLKELMRLKAIEARMTQECKSNLKEKPITTSKG
jgi:hypothetical protein